MLSEFHDTICNFIDDINNLLWGFGTFLLIFGTGVYFTIRIKFFNIIHIVHIIKSTVFINKKSALKKQNGKLSQFQALSTSLAASMGTGNIVGVAAAISMGGAGAIFWMWISAIFGTATGFVENILGVKYQRQGCSPMSYISSSANFPAMGYIYAAACAAAAFGVGNMTQTNAISAAAAGFGISPLITGVITAFLCGIIISGGGKKIASATEKLVPFAALFYLVGAAYVIVLFRNNITNILMQIVSSAMGYSQITGGFCGAALKKAVTVGLRRGVFSNEAGLGSSVLVHTETECDEPVQMGMWAVIEVVIDTLICCTATAFVILLTGADSSGADGLALVSEAFRRGIGVFSAPFISAATIIFAFCTLIGWYFYGEKCVRFISRNGNSKAIILYRILYTAAAFSGTLAELKLVWGAADLLNWFMLVINLTAVILLNREAVECLNKYTKRIKNDFSKHFTKL